MKILVLDAMGVIYSTGDDVRDLLCPFLKEKGGMEDFNEIDRLYNLASSGKMTASEFWKRLGIDPRFEDEYLQKHELSGGVTNFLETLNARGYEIWLLSNDISEWSKKLRVRFDLDKYFRGFVISGDVGIRKPDRGIFDHLMSRLRLSPDNVLFVDDRIKNLDSAAIVGLETIFFDPNAAQSKHRVVRNFSELLSILPP